MEVSRERDREREREREGDREKRGEVVVSFTDMHARIHFDAPVMTITT